MKKKNEEQPKVHRNFKLSPVAAIGEPRSTVMRMAMRFGLQALKEDSSPERLLKGLKLKTPPTPHIGETT